MALEIRGWNSHVFGLADLWRPGTLTGGNWEMDIYQVDFLKHQRFYMLMLPVFQGLRLDL